VKDKKRLGRLAEIIYDENARLGSHIERVLNIAKMEEGNIWDRHLDTSDALDEFIN
jgi:two-component system phosphate regulon sensor histidine kinase PhoR